VVAWEPIGGEHAPAAGECQFLEDAGFQIRLILRPPQALAQLAQRRIRFASQEATVWTALNVDAVAIAIVRGAEVLYARSFSWTYTPGLTQSRAILLQRYSLVAHLAPQIRHGIDAVRASHDLSVDRIVTCGNLPDLRSLTMPLVGELDLEVETLDSIEGLRAAAHVTTDNLIDAAPAVRLAVAAALVAPGSTPGIGRDGSLSPQDLRDAIRRDMERSSERCRAHSKLLELVSQDLPRMNCRSSHLEISSVVVNDFTVDRLVGTVRPFEADAPLGVDPDAELAGPIASERFESVTRERPQ
jgi:hypothetical protein